MPSFECPTGIMCLEKGLALLEKGLIKKKYLLSAVDTKSTPMSTTLSFRDAVLKGLVDDKSNDMMMQVGENGCLEYSNAGIHSNVLAISQLVRGADSDDIQKLAKTILSQGTTNEIVDLFVLNFVIRNTRGGKGEKKLAYDLFLFLWQEYPETAMALLPCFVHYGYWKDIFLIMELAMDLPEYDKLQDEAFLLIYRQWVKDLAAIEVHESKLQEAKEFNNNEKLVDEITKNGPKISLLAKWLPREGKALDKKINFVQNFSSKFLASPSSSSSSSRAAASRYDPDANSLTTNDCWKSVAKKDYRKQVSKMTSYLNLPEVLLAARRADEIKISCVASKATKILTRAFLNEDKNGMLRNDDDAKRMKLRDMFLDEIVKRGLKGGRVMPHEIVSTILKNGHISKGMELSLDAQWKSMWTEVVDQVKCKAEKDGIDFDPTKMVPISDVSGSMSGTPMEVAIALGIGISEITHPSFRNLVMTFSERPEWFHLDENDTIVQKVRKLANAPWGFNTNFAKAYDLVLEVCEKNKLERKDMPCLIVFSDMQFDHACSSSSKTMFQHIRSRVKTVASNLGWADCEPSPIVFWNLRNSSGHPVSKDTEGTVLLSGFSPSLLKFILNGDALKEEEVEVVQADGTVKKEKIRVTPEEILQNMLSDPLYDLVRRVLAKSTENRLKEYELLGHYDSEDLDFEFV